MSKKADKFIDKYIVGKNDWLLKNKEVISKLLDEYEAEQLTIPVVVFSEAELKAKLEEQLEETRQWLIGEDFEGLAERL